MTKETVVVIFGNHRRYNFKIITNIHEYNNGHIANNIYYGEIKDQNLVETNLITEFNPECLVLRHTSNDRGWIGGEHCIFLPYENICTIDFIVDSVKSDIYPMELSSTHPVYDTPIGPGDVGPEMQN